MTVTIPTLTTERMIMRAPRLDDLDVYAEFGASDRSKGVGGPYTRGQCYSRLSALLGHWQLHGFGRWMLADKDTDMPLGVVGLLNPEGWPEPEIGWSVFAHAEGRGLAYEAAQAARRYAYDVVGLTTVISLCALDNPRTVALAKRMGCTYERVFPHADYGDLHVWRHPAPADLPDGGVEAYA